MKKNEFSFGMMIGVLTFVQFLEGLPKERRDDAITAAGRLSAESLAEMAGAPVEDVLLELQPLVDEALSRLKEVG